MASPRIEFESDVFSPTGITLLVDGTSQSHVDPHDPTRLFFEYVRRIALRMRVDPDWSGRCTCSHTDGHSAIAAITGSRNSLG